MTRAVSRQQLARSIAVLAEAGTPVKGLLCMPDGSIAVLTEAPSAPLASNDGDWVDLAGQNGADEHSKGH